MRPTIPYVDLAAQFAEERDELMARVTAVFESGRFINGPDVELFEQEVAAFIGVRHAVALGSGTDALILSLRALGIGAGNEVITPPNSFVASTSAIVAVGATPVFADVRADGNIDPDAVAAAVTSHTRAIMPVHLTGRMADMAPLMAIADSYGLAVIEDAAQAIGSRYDGRMAGAFGDVGCFSAHPLKNMNAAGDAGFLTTDDDAVAEKVRLYRNIGLSDHDTVTEWGRVSRMDSLQAAVLRLRLERLPSVIERRCVNVARYRARLDPAKVFAPPCRDIEFNTFHTFVVQVDRRDALKAHLAEQGIRTTIHYPIPIHLQPVAAPLGYREGDMPVCEAQAKRIISLPVHQFLHAGDIDAVVDAIHGFLP